MQITVPTNLGANPLKIIIGGVEYALGAGETIDVPAEVVAEMNRMQASMEHPDMPVDIPFKDAEQEADIQANATAIATKTAALEAKTDPFLVTLTPTALDYSGTMDKTVAEIYAAYQAGKKIVFRLATSASTHIDVDITLVGTEESKTYPSFEGYVIQSSTNLMIYAYTGVTEVATDNTYLTAIYALTPAT